MVTTKFSRTFACKKCEGNIGEAVEQEKKLGYEVETVSVFMHLGGRVNEDGGVSRWVKFVECGD